MSAPRTTPGSATAAFFRPGLRAVFAPAASLRPGILLTAVAAAAISAAIRTDPDLPWRALRGAAEAAQSVSDGLSGAAAGLDRRMQDYAEAVDRRIRPEMYVDEITPAAAAAMAAAEREAERKAQDAARREADEARMENGQTAAQGRGRTHHRTRHAGSRRHAEHAEHDAEHAGHAPATPRF